VIDRCWIATRPTGLSRPAAGPAASNRPISARAIRLGAALLLVAAVGGAQEECFECHDTVDAEAFAASLHGSFLECTDCHEGAADEAHMDGIAPVECATCHAGIEEELAGSIHGPLLHSDLAGPTGCAGCHGDPHVFPSSDDPASPIHPVQVARTCGSCHADAERAELLGIPRVRPLEAYLSSVHGLAVERGEHAASCNDCHGSHSILRATDPRSSVNYRNVPETCGTCHQDVAETFAGSVHGQALARGEREAPTCTDCHGEHHILSPAEPGSPVFASNVPRMTCGRCHGDVRLAEKYGLPSDRMTAYQDSYHGLAMRSGSVTVAHCGSCHGIHDILPSSNAASHVHKDRLAETCGQCHPGAGASFAIGPVHVLATERQHAAVFWVRQIYLWLIFLTIGGMVMHNGLDLYRKARRPDVWRPAAAGTGSGGERLSLGFRIAHGMLAVSFLALVYTGFALKYPESWWSAPLLQWEDSFGLRGGLHRVAAVVMLTAAALHACHLALSPAARACIAKMRPGRGDLRELGQRLAWLFGRREHPPIAPSVGYPEKMEYLAVVWGTAIMALTGLALWFESLVLRWLPSWWLDLATVVHFYEAILASLAILVWHFYFVIFDPLVYPMDPAWLTGRSAPGREAEREDD
jgi:cytochrome b subunit of formate dehydrogenase